MAKIKIVQAGWLGYTGDYGQVAFKDGVSVEHLSKREINVIGASVMIVEVDEHGNEGRSPALQDNMQGAVLMEAPVLEPLPRATEEEAAAEAKRDEKAARLGPAVDPTALVFHTKDELEALAEKKGINGLRALAEPLKVKGRSINELVKEILKAEAKLKAHADALAASSETTREPAPAPVPAADADGVVAEGGADAAPSEPAADGEKASEPAADAEQVTH